MPQVSVIIPTFNNAQYIGEALNSVFSQDYDAYEVIVVDDGSTDDTQQTLKPYLDRIRFIYQSNAGSAAARNTGLTLAQGEFIVFLDADDFLLPGKLKQQVAYLTLKPQLGIVHSGWRIVSETGAIISTVEPWHEAPHLDLETWLKYKPVKMGPMMFRRRWLERVGGFDPSLRQSQDTDLILRLALAGCQAEWIYQPTLCYRTHPASTTRKHALHQSEAVLTVLHKFFGHPHLPKHIRAQKQLKYYYTLIWLAWYLYRAGYITEMTEHLQQTLDYSPYNNAMIVLLDWIGHFEKWNVREGFSEDILLQIETSLRIAAPISDLQWHTVKQLYQIWHTDKTDTDDRLRPALRNLFQLWESTFNHTVPGDLTKAKTLFKWLSQVWRPYASNNRAQGLQALTSFKGLSAQELTQLIQASIAYNSGTLTPEGLTQFWRDIIDSGLIPASERASHTAIFLTAFGQAVLSRQWQKASVYLSQALQSSNQKNALRVWSRFIAQAARYVGQRGRQLASNRIS
jgi:glycosyltransferase involved in cell wall biosynthesis